MTYRRLYSDHDLSGDRIILIMRNGRNSFNSRGLKIRLNILALFQIINYKYKL